MIRFPNMQELAENSWFDFQHVKLTDKLCQIQINQNEESLTCSLYWGLFCFLLLLAFLTSD